VLPGAFVDTGSVHARKRAALACHASQREFLDHTQGMDSYLRTMDDFSRALGKLSGRFTHADALGRKYRINVRYERSLERYV
jgi:hypothetical protein